jgi:hypothetical protein
MSTTPRVLARTDSTGTTAILTVTLCTILACGESPMVPANSGPQPRLDLSVWFLDADDTIPVHSLGAGRWSERGRLAAAPGVLVASGTFWPGEIKGRLRRVTRGVVRINGIESLGVRQADGSLQFVLEMPLARSADSVTVMLPGVEGVQPVYDTYGPPALPQPGSEFDVIFRYSTLLSERPSIGSSFTLSRSRVVQSPRATDLPYRLAFG